MADRIGLGLVAVSGAALLTIPAVLDAVVRATDPNAQHAQIAGSSARSLAGTRLRAQQLFSAHRYAEASAEARAALALAPLDRTALRVLSMAEQAQGHDEVAGELIVDASFVTWHDPYTQLQLYGLAMRSRDWPAAARRADALSRIAGFRNDGFTALADLIDSGRGTDVAARLAIRPPWRADFLRWLSRRKSPSSEQALPLLAALARTSAPASEQEAASIFQHLIVNGRGERAYAFWRDGAGPGRGRGAIADPDLARVEIAAPGIVASPFAWTAAPAAMVRLAPARGPSGRPALAVEPTDDRSAMFVSVRFAVAPGRYVLGYSAAGSPAQLDRLHPDVSCPGIGRLPAEPLVSAASAGEARYRYAVQMPRDCGLLTFGFTLEASAEGDPTPITIRAVAFDPGS